MEVKVANQQKDTVIESELVSRTTTKIVNLNHTKEFPECMNSYKIGIGVHSFDMIGLAIAFYECSCNVHLIVTKSSALNYWQYTCKQHSGCTFHDSFGHHYSTGLLHMKKGNFRHNGFIAETTAKGGQKFKKRRKGEFQQSYVLASSTHKSSPKPADIQITAGNYEGEDLTYNISWRKCQKSRRFQ